MRAMVCPTFVVLLSGCSLASGPQGDAGTDAPGLVWKDATGTQVTGGEELLWVDPSGRHWVMNQETAQPYLEPFDVYFDQASCTGTPYAVTFLPRRVFRLVGETALRARPDTLGSVLVDLASRRASDGNCFPHAVTAQRMLSIDGTSLPSPPIEAPSLGFAPPLHLEAR